MIHFYEIMPEYPVLCMERNGILIMPSPWGRREGIYFRCPALWAGRLAFSVKLR